jgi:hypothetical protein
MVLTGSTAGLTYTYFTDAREPSSAEAGAFNTKPELVYQREPCSDVPDVQPGHSNDQFQTNLVMRHEPALQYIHRNGRYYQSSCSELRVAPPGPHVHIFYGCRYYLSYYRGTQWPQAVHPIETSSGCSTRHTTVTVTP